MLWALIPWLRECKRRSSLKSEYLAERNENWFYNSFGELEEDYEETMHKVREKYLKLGLTSEDIQQVEQNNPWVRIE